MSDRARLLLVRGAAQGRDCDRAGGHGHWRAVFSRLLQGRRAAARFVGSAAGRQELVHPLRARRVGRADTGDARVALVCRLLQQQDSMRVVLVVDDSSVYGCARR